MSTAQTSVRLSSAVNATVPASLVAQEGCTSLEALVVNLVTGPLTRPVRGEIPTSHKSSVSPTAADNTTVLPAADQQTGGEREAGLDRVRPVTAPIPSRAS